MGKEGNGKGSSGAPEAASGALVLDAGALIAFERFDDRIDALLDEAIEGGDEILVPASALAQAWRGGSRSARLARLIAGAESDALDEARAKEVGERLGTRAKTDIADAHVVCCALEYEATVVTSDGDDIEALATPDESLLLVSV